MKQLHFFVSGRVQGVCYRHYVAKKARAIGINGFVMNLSDGRVKILAEGENKKIKEFVHFCKNNPGHSDVEKLEVFEETEVKNSGFDGFNIR